MSSCVGSRWLRWGEILPERNRVVPCLIFRGKEQRHGGTRCLFQDGPNSTVVFGEFCEVASLKLVPFLRLMFEPPSQFSGRGDFSKPKIDLGPLLGQTPRPKPVDEDPHTIITRCSFVDSLDDYLHRRHCFASSSRCCCKSLLCVRAHGAKREKRATLRFTITNLSLQLCDPITKRLNRLSDFLFGEARLDVLRTVDIPCVDVE